MPKLSDIEQVIDSSGPETTEGNSPEMQPSQNATSSETTEQVRSRMEGALSIAENMILGDYKQLYDRLPEEIKKRCDWKIVSERLLANGGEKLKRVEAMRGGGDLVGIDAEGRAMFKDKGVEPLMYVIDLKTKQITLILDRYAEDMETARQKIAQEKAQWANYLETREQVLKDGYELFVDSGKGLLKSKEMKQVEAHTNEPFVASKGRNKWRASWLDSDEGAVWACYIGFDPDVGRVDIGYCNPEVRNEDRGFVRLLRV